jgi:hypothetical protein
LQDHDCFADVWLVERVHCTLYAIVHQKSSILKGSHRAELLAQNAETMLGFVCLGSWLPIGSLMIVGMHIVPCC